MLYKQDNRISVLLKFSAKEYTALHSICPRGITVGQMLKRYIIYQIKHTQSFRRDILNAVEFKK